MRRMSSAVRSCRACSGRPASGRAITFTFNCQVTPQSPGDSCVAGGPFGSVTLLDSLVDPNRVDVFYLATPPTGDRDRARAPELRRDLAAE